MKFDSLVFIGRFQPVHVGHLRTIHKALEIAQNVIVVIGSSFKPRTAKNPWSFEDRREMLISALSRVRPGITSRVHFTYAYDHSYNNQKWVEEVQTRVKAFIPNPKANIGIIGLDKDDSTFYLKLFPQWEYVASEKVGDNIDATRVRTSYFEETDEFDCLTESTIEFLKEFRNTEAYKQIKEEYDFLKRYKTAWGGAPHPPTFVTVDAVVVQAGHILLVKRGAMPGMGNYALPGGFLAQNEACLDSCIRELREETKLKVPDPVLRGSIKDSKVFDNPGRSLRGRTITIAYLFELSGGALPKAKGGDDAKAAEWIPLSEIDSMRDNMFEDHADIISYFVGRL